MQTQGISEMKEYIVNKYTAKYLNIGCRNYMLLQNI